MFHVEQNDKLIDIKKCPVCSGNNLSSHLKTRDFFFTQEEFSTSQCEDCNLVFTNPIPKDLSKYYETPDYLSHNTGNNGAMGRLYSAIRDINIKRKFRLVSKYCQQGSILDIGCGTGELLNYFKNKNWATTGVEPNSSARKFAKSNYNINVFDEDGLDHIQPATYITGLEGVSLINCEG